MNARGSPRKERPVWLTAGVGSGGCLHVFIDWLAKYLSSCTQLTGLEYSMRCWVYNNNCNQQPWSMSSIKPFILSLNLFADKRSGSDSLEQTSVLGSIRYAVDDSGYLWGWPARWTIYLIDDKLRRFMGPLPINTVCTCNSLGHGILPTAVDSVFLIYCALLFL